MDINVELLGNLIAGKEKYIVAEKILKHYDYDFHKLSRADESSIMIVSGVGKTIAAKVRNIFLFNRAILSQLNQRDVSTQFRQSHEIYEYIRYIFFGLNEEHFYVCYLNRANRVIKCSLISSGGVHGTVVDITTILKHAIAYSASGIVMMHNHPSGNLKPSDQDKKLTNNVKESCDLMSIRLLDHLIITDHGYYSFADEGLIIN
jgi:DNA repair protein RadC